MKAAMTQSKSGDSPRTAPEYTGSVHWSEPEKQVVIEAGRRLLKRPETRHLSSKRLFVRAMHEALPPHRYLKSIRSIPKKRYQFFCDALKLGPAVEDVEEQEPIGKTEFHVGRQVIRKWSPEEKQAVVDAGMVIARKNPHASVKQVFAKAMVEALDPDRHYEAGTMRSMPAWRYQFFRDAIQPILVEALRSPAREAPVQEAPVQVPEVKEEPQVKTMPTISVGPLEPPAVAEVTTKGRAPLRKPRVFWTLQEREKIIEAAIPIFQDVPVISRRALLTKAQEAALPPERQRFPETFPAKELDWCWEVVIRRAMEAARYATLLEPDPEPDPEQEPEQPEQSPGPVVEPAPEIGAITANGTGFATPAILSPPQPPAPVVEIRTEPVSSMDTRGLMRVLQNRQIEEQEALQEDIRTLRKDLSSLRAATERTEALLRKVLEMLDPSIVAGASKHASNGSKPAVSRDLAEIGQTPEPPKMRICVTGATQNSVGPILDQTHEFAYVDVICNSKDTLRKGFKSYDFVLLTSHCRHEAAQRAFNDLGRDKVIRVANASPSEIALKVKNLYAQHGRKFMAELVLAGKPDEVGRN